MTGSNGHGGEKKTSRRGCDEGSILSRLVASPTLHKMPWWAVLGGLVGAVQVFAGLTLVNKVGSGPFVGLSVTAALLASLAIDHFGWFRMDVHPLNLWRALGGLLLIGGVTLIAKF
jgi:bacterial/archaeal transporter family-2 protein